MPRPTHHLPLTILTAVLALAGAAPAVAHQADADYDSVLRGVQPRVPGLRVSVLSRGDRLAIANRTGRTVEIPGYRDEPYLRLLPDGTVQENLRSQATFVNRDPSGKTAAPASADASGPTSTPRWRTIDRSSRVEFHDHRIHWMGEKGRPAPQVRDPRVRQAVVDWRVPIRVQGTAAAIDGTLFWTPDDGGDFPLLSVAGLVLLVVGGIGLASTFIRPSRSLDGAADTESLPPSAGL